MEKKILDDALKAEMQNVIKEAKQQFVAAKASRSKVVSVYSTQFCLSFS